MLTRINNKYECTLKSQKKLLVGSIVRGIFIGKKDPKLKEAEKEK